MDQKTYLTLLHGVNPIYVYRSDRVVGTFTSVDSLLAHSFDPTKVYYTNLQPNHALVAGNSLHFMNKALTEQSVTAQNYVLVDIDPVRPPGINATEQELNSAKLVIDGITEYISSFADRFLLKASGNGYHLIVPVQNLTKELHRLILLDLKFRFDTDEAKVDTKVFNNSRVHKLPGLWLGGKASAADRPNRRCEVLTEQSRLGSSEFLGAPNAGCVWPQVELPTTTSLTKATYTPKTPKELAPHRIVSVFTNTVKAVTDWLAMNNVETVSVGPHDGAYRFVLKECPWNPNHTDRSVFVLVLPNGAISAGCLHESCPGHNGQENKWVDMQSCVETRYSMFQYRLKNVDTIAVPAAALDQVHLTELGNAEIFARLYGDRVRYVADLRRWYVWDGMVWVEDRQDSVKRLAATIPNVLREVANGNAKVLKWAVSSESATRINATLDLARTKGDISIVSARFDSDPELLNTKSGIVNLRTGVIGPHDPQAFQSRIVPYYVSPGEPTRFIKFLAEVFDTAELRLYTLALLAYSLTGLRTEQSLYMLFGTGRNGKSTLLEVLGTILGDYALSQSPEVIFGEDQHPTGLTDFEGKRFVFVDDPKRNCALNVGLIKRLTGSEQIRARKMRADYMSFVATHKLWIAINYKPIVAEQDEGIWDRIKLINCRSYFAETVRDKSLKEKLLLEAPQILFMLIGICQQILQSGISTPARIQAAVDEYRLEMDLLSSFLREVIVPAPGAKLPIRDLYNAYRVWCSNNNEDAMKMRTFSRALLERKYEQGVGGSQRYWKDMELRPQRLLIDADLAQVVA